MIDNTRNICSYCLNYRIIPKCIPETINDIVFGKNGTDDVYTWVNVVQCVNYKGNIRDGKLERKNGKEEENTKNMENWGYNDKN